MPIDITVPRLGWNMDEAVFVAWHKQDGDPVKAGDPIFSLETDKAVQEIESLDAGTLRMLASGPLPGQTLAVGTVIARLVQAGESDAGREISLEARPSVAATASPAEAHSPRPVVSAPERAPKSGMARSSPRARRKAHELGLDWTTLEGTGRGGRVRERDVLGAAASTGTPPRPGPHDATLSPFVEGEFTAIPIDATRRAIAGRMMQGARETAAVTLSSTIDATNLVNLRQQFKAVAQAPGESDNAAAIGYADIVIKLAALALERHPMLNSRWDGEQILQFRGIHIGLAVDTEAGLLVPVIRDVPKLTLRQVAARARDLIDRSRRRQVRADELQGGTFTVTNLGAFGIDMFTPIINFPQCAVLGLGRIQKVPVAKEPQFAARDRLTVSLTFDHRIVDGAPAARFLQTLGSLLENPSPWLLP